MGTIVVVRKGRASDCQKQRMRVMALITKRVYDNNSEVGAGGKSESWVQLESLL